MIDPVVLDNESYEDIFEELRSVANRYYPGWTDFNIHDPGITLLQLFALRKEEQQFFMDQIGNDHLRSYLKLLSIHKRTIKPAACMIRMTPPSDMLLADNLKLYADDLTFELDGAKQLVNKDIDMCMHEASDGKIQKWRRRGHLFDQMGGRFLAFGQKPETGNHMYLRIEAPLPVDRQLSLYLSFFSGSENRTPIEDENGNDFRDFVPFADISVEYFAGGEWKNALFQNDDTKGFIRDGFFYFQIKEAMTETAVFKEKGFFLRLTYQKGQFDIPPCLTNVSLNVAKALQKDTRIEGIWAGGTSESVTIHSSMAQYSINRLFRKEEDKLIPVDVIKKELLSDDDAVRFLLPASGKKNETIDYFVINIEWEARELHMAGTGKGLPGQRIVLEEKGIMPESLSLLVQDEIQPLKYKLWSWVDDFGGYGSEDLVFSFDEDENAIVFGDGICGCVPEGKILIASCCFTKGPAGNIKSRRIDRIRGIAMSGTALSNITEGKGGAYGETYRDCFLRVMNLLKQPQTAVSAGDVEERIKRTPGLCLEAVKVLSVEEVGRFEKNASALNLYTMIRPYGHKPGEPLHPGYRLNILRYMEHYRPVGSQIVLYPPEYVKIEVFVDAVVRAEYRYVEILLEKDLQKWFGEFEDKFGCEIKQGILFAWIRKRPYILFLKSLDLSVKGTGARQNRDGDILIVPNGIAEFDCVHFVLSMA